MLQRLIELAEYTSEAYNNLCDRLGVVQSMGRVGSALDNAAAESFNSLMKVEYIHRHPFVTRAEARLKIATWITDFYNPRRRHSGAAGRGAHRVRTNHQRSTRQAPSEGPSRIRKVSKLRGD
ncbi:integrase core domain-containing protein [Streptomyces sp. NPDC005795]|uniref:integrase core domain-containing protein n=1 Tax=Streptomyces sp. NPDC005795 TaxID=3154677 RepID=UPI0033E6D8E4